MVKKENDNKYTLTGLQTSELFYILSVARIKLTGKVQTSADKHWEAFEKVLGLKLDFPPINKDEI